ncbi:hypothetical protein GTCCBUS3UF5_24040 [Geobacillus thermoleovorans CCB_US3_UF5]|uniref:Uncharacterized protein n=1 Tax=Geobacillus thermoleovorans CCB_US3_UF5 TaxID=1111068 RepID=A0ABM5MJ34_GEOTH|nr:hypothetical protein GTCCBUS3UF5_24040 [Geobacillus thermoleovorans CCB_US3_UF5]
MKRSCFSGGPLGEAKRPRRKPQLFEAFGHRNGKNRRY